MSRAASNPEMTAIRGPVLTYTGDAFLKGLESTMRHESDAIVVMVGGKITHFGPAGEVRSQLPRGTPCVTPYLRT